MNDERKKPGIAFWATVVAILVGLYPVSLGPAAALVETGLLSAERWESMYAPVLNINERCGVLESCVRSYVAMCAGPGEVNAILSARWCARHADYR